MTAGHDLRRTDEPVPQWEAVQDILVWAVILVRHASDDTVVRGDLDRLRTAVQRAGIDSRRT